MPILPPLFAGTNFELTRTFYKAGVATSLVGASIKASLKESPDDTDAAAVATITTTLTASGQVTLTTGEAGVANSGYILKFLPAATSALVTTLPDADLYLDVRVKESDNDEYIALPTNPDDPVRVPIRRPVTRSVT